jgi:hypothetical protein
VVLRVRGLDLPYHFVIRRKDSWKPKVQRVVRGNVTKTFLGGQIRADRAHLAR